MRISDWSSDVCSSDLQLQELVRRLRATAHLSAHAVEPADQLQVEVGVAAEVVVHPRAAFEQAGQDLVDVLDRVGVVHDVAVDGALRAGARPVPGLARGVAVAAEQQVLAVLRSAERRVGTEWVRTGRSRWSPEQSKKKKPRK